MRLIVQISRVFHHKYSPCCQNTIKSSTINQLTINTMMSYCVLPGLIITLACTRWVSVCASLQIHIPVREVAGCGGGWWPGGPVTSGCRWGGDWRFWPSLLLNCSKEPHRRTPLDFRELDLWRSAQLTIILPLYCNSCTYVYLDELVILSAGKHLSSSHFSIGNYLCEILYRERYIRWADEYKICSI